MTFYPHNFKLGQLIQTDVEGLQADACFGSHLTWDNPAAAAANNVLAATALDAGAITEVVAGITNPDVPRALQIKGNQAGVAGNVVIDGTNINDEVIRETIAADEANAVEGNLAFKTVTKITLPAQTAAGDTISVGCADKLGLPYLLPTNTVILAALNNAREANAPTVATNAANLENNTIDLASALNGTQVDVYLMV